MENTLTLILWAAKWTAQKSRKEGGVGRDSDSVDPISTADILLYIYVHVLFFSLPGLTLKLTLVREHLTPYGLLPWLIIKGNLSQNNTILGRITALFA